MTDLQFFFSGNPETVMEKTKAIQSEECSKNIMAAENNKVAEDKGTYQQQMTLQSP